MFGTQKSPGSEGGRAAQGGARPKRTNNTDGDKATTGGKLLFVGLGIVTGLTLWVSAVAIGARMD